MKDQRTATCPCCHGPMKPQARVCQRCRTASRCCRVCHTYEPGLVDGQCRECFLALEAARLHTDNGRRPQGFALPPGHLDALAVRAAAGLPLFAEGGASCRG